MKSDDEKRILPKISVIIPMYNSEQHLAECLDSVINQTLKELEIICINDGSTDNTANIVFDYARKDNRVFYVYHENQGAGASRNKGMSLAKGKYVAFMDSDDYYPEHDVLETLYDASEKFGTVIAGGGFELINPDGTIVDSYRFKDDPLFYGYYFEKHGVMSYKDYQFDYGYQRFIYNRCFLISNGIEFPLLARFQDPPFFVKAMSQAGEFYATNKMTYRYRSMSSNIDWNKKRVADLLKGLFWNLDFADKSNYTKLHDLTARRLADEYRWHVNRLISILDSEIAQEKLEIERRNYILDEMARLKQIENSYSYRTGLIVTFIPRKIVKCLLRIMTWR